MDCMRVLCCVRGGKDAEGPTTVSRRAKHFAIPNSLNVVGLTRFELVTPRLSSVCSNQLSYRPDFAEASSGEPSELCFKELQPPRPALSKLDRTCLH